MAEILEEIKKLSRAEQLALVQQIWDLDAEPISEEERQMLIARAGSGAEPAWRHLLGRSQNAHDGQDAGSYVVRREVAWGAAA